MIKILTSILDENVSIVINDGNISIESKNKAILGLVNSIYNEVLESYGPADGLLGAVIAKELEAFGARILNVEEPSMEEDMVY